MGSHVTSTLPCPPLPQAMKCCSSWIEFGLPLPEIQGLVGQMLQALLDEGLFSQASDTLADLVAHQESMK